MGWIEDSVEEFRKLPTPGKIAVGGAAVGVAILAYAHYRATAANGAASSGATAPSATDSTLSGLGVPSLASSPADWANWFSNGLTIPATPTQTSDGAPPSVTTPVTTPGTSSNPSNPIATFTAPAGAAAAAATSAATASAHVASSASAPKPAPAPSYPIQNPTVAQTAAHVGTLAPVNPTFIPTTIRPLPTPGRGRVA